MKNLLLFDVDNTLSISRGKVTEEMKELLAKLSKTYDLATVSGSDLPKMLEQLGSSAMYFRWLFTENGLVAYLDHQLAAPYHKTDIIKELGEDYYQRFVNRALELISQTQLEKKRGTFVELRNGLVNVCPIGRNCSQEERDAFEAYDKVHQIRATMCRTLRKEFDDKLTFSIGGQISFDVFPYGWDKTYCLRFIHGKYDQIHFFGDKIVLGGNDYEIGNDVRVVSHSVTCWQDTYKLLETML